MSEATPATSAAAAPGHYGAAGSQLVMSEAIIATAWNVQGDFASGAFMAAAERIAGVGLPIASNTTSKGEGVTALWLGPASWLLIAGGARPLTDFVRARDALSVAGGAVFDVSASRVAFTLAGVRVADVLASGCPLDFHPRAFGADACRQSLFARVPALFHRSGDACTILVARSFARETWQRLCTAAAQYGYTVNAPHSW